MQYFVSRIPFDKRNIHGVLLVDKLHGLSSNKAVQIAKRIFSATKCGHTGTLDPMATGLLPLCFGEATKFSSVLLNADKAYEATLKLGFLSTTGDAEGEITQLTTNINTLTLKQCKQELAYFIGKITQVPPMYSAIKHQGKPLYAYARNGMTIERQARQIYIHDIQINSLVKNELQLSIRCSTGTYIRTLAEDIGKALGCGGAYLTQLRRTAIDSFNLSQAKTLSILEAMDAINQYKCLLPIDCLLEKFSPIILNQLAARHIVQGRTVISEYDINILQPGDIVRLYDLQQRFIGLGQITADQKISAKRLIANSFFQ
jgi:tRNA pseudouridine55 synthase